MFLPMKSYGGSGFLGLPWAQHMAELLLKGTSAHRGHNTRNEGQLGRSFSLGELLVQSLCSELMLLGQSMTLGSTFYTAGFSGSLTILAAAAAKSLQSCPTLCDPMDCSPPGSPVPGIPQAILVM